MTQGMAVQDISESIDICAGYYGEQAEEVKAYLLAGQGRALSLDNRGPIRFDSDGKLDATIREAYSRHGFYVFEGVLSQEELTDLETDLASMRDRFPTGPESAVDRAGRPALGTDNKALTLLWSKPLGDPLGGTELANGRHEVKMFEPEAEDAAFGARPLKRAIQSEIENPLAKKILAGDFIAKDKVEVGFSKQKFTFTKT